jgi:hypothetical protein
MAGLGEKILGFLSGGFAEKGVELIGKVVRDKDQADRLAADFRTLCQTQDHELQRITLEAEAEAERQFNERTISMEGTASDLQAIPWIGAVVIFLRGAFRPLFAYFTAFLDYEYFVTGMAWTERQESLLLAINLLVLIFFFGERAMKNVMPIIVQMFAVKADVK